MQNKEIFYEAGLFKWQTPDWNINDAMLQYHEIRRYILYEIVKGIFLKIWKPQREMKLSGIGDLGSIWDNMCAGTFIDEYDTGIRPCLGMDVKRI